MSKLSPQFDKVRESVRHALAAMASGDCALHRLLGTRAGRQALRRVPIAVRGAR